MKALLLTLTTCLFVLPAQAKYSGGTGEPNDPYQIATAADLIALGEDPNDYDKHFVLVTDMDLDPNLPGCKVFDRAVIATFVGVFDGNDHTISHLTITGGSLFGKLGASAEVKHLQVVDVNVTGGFAGGLVGENSGTVTHCSSAGVVRGGGRSGGLVGQNLGTVTDCHSSASVTGTWSGVGGLVGQNQGVVTRCYSTGAVVSTSMYVGGLVGDNLSGFVDQCYSAGTVSGDFIVGGLVGWNYGDAIVSNSYSTGAVSGGSGVGGFVGWNDSFAFGGGHVTRCYCTGAVSGPGGTAGAYNGTVALSFWDLQTSGPITTSAGGTGLTTAKMQNPQTYLDAGWDWVDEVNNGTSQTWQMPQGGGYPVLAVFNGYVPPQLQGEGTPDDPYLISDAFDLGAMTHYSPDAHYRLARPIDLSGMRWGMAAVPRFAGVFDGNNLTISHLAIQGGAYLGLFGRLDSGAQVRDLGVVDVSITGSGDFVGALAGLLYDAPWGSRGLLVTRCYTTGSVRGSGSWEGVGGLVGYNYFADVTDCYSTAFVKGGSSVGGLVGYHWGGIVTRCYGAGAVSGNSNVGGLVGYLWNGTVTSSFWDTQTSGRSTSAGGVGKTTAEMKTAKTFLDAGWDLADETANGMEDVWRINEGKDYPRLRWEAPQAPPIKYGGGTGEPNDPYLISTAEQMNAIGANPADWDKHFRLMADIDLSAYAGRFNMIGTSAEDNFTGVFDGNGHTISHLTISGGSYLGLFSRLKYPAEIKDLGLLDISVTTGANVSSVGGLVGSNGHYLGNIKGGAITNCYSTGVVSGAGPQANSFGGLVGSNYGEVSQCYSTATVTASWNVGGLVGDNGNFVFAQGVVRCCYSTGTVRCSASRVGGLVAQNYATITCCYSTGAVSSGLPSAPWTGGLVAANSGTVTHCYSTGAVSGTGWYAGGLTCWSMGTVTGCFWDIQTSGQTTSAAGTGKTTLEMQRKSTFLSAKWDFDGEAANGSEDLWTICEGKGYPRLRWENMKCAGVR